MRRDGGRWRWLCPLRRPAVATILTRSPAEEAPGDGGLSPRGSGDGGPPPRGSGDGHPSPTRIQWRHPPRDEYDLGHAVAGSDGALSHDDWLRPSTARIWGSGPSPTWIWRRWLSPCTNLAAAAISCDDDGDLGDDDDRR